MAKIYRKRGNKLNEVVTFDSACTRQENQPLVYDATDGSVHTTTHINCLDANDLSVNNLTVTGQAIIQEQVTDTIDSNTLVLRSNADAGLTGTENSGVIIHNYNGSEDLYAVTDNTGTFRVGTAVSTTTTYAYLRYNETDNKWYSTAPGVTPAVEVTPVGSPTSWDSVVTSGDDVEYTNIVFSVIDRTSLEPLTTRDESTDMEADYLTKWNDTDEKIITTGTSCTHDLCANGDITSTGDITAEGNVCVKTNITVDHDSCVVGDSTVSGKIHSCKCITAPTACVSDDLYVAGDINNCNTDSIFHGSYGCFEKNVCIKGDLAIDGTIAVSSLTSDHVISVENTTNSSFYLPFVQNNHLVAGSNDLYTNGDLQYNPSTDVLCTKTFCSDRGIVQSAFYGVTAANLGLTAGTAYSLSTIVSCLQACCGNKAVSYSFSYENASNPKVTEYGNDYAYGLTFEKLDNNSLSGTWSKSRWLVTGACGVSWTVNGTTGATAGDITWTACEHVVDQVCVNVARDNINYPLILSDYQSTSSCSKKTLYTDNANYLTYNPSKNTLNARCINASASLSQGNFSYKYDFQKNHNNSRTTLLVLEDISCAVCCSDCAIGIMGKVCDSRAFYECETSSIVEDVNFYIKVNDEATGSSAMDIKYYGYGENQLRPVIITRNDNKVYAAMCISGPKRCLSFDTIGACSVINEVCVDANGVYKDYKGCTYAITKAGDLATLCVNASSSNVWTTNINSNYPIVFSTCQATPAAGCKTLYNDSANNLMYNPSTNTLSVPNVNASGTVCATNGFTSASNGFMVRPECSNEVNLYSPSGNCTKVYVNHRGGVDTVWIGKGDGTNDLGTVCAATFCGDLCGMSEKIKLNTTSTCQDYSMPIVTSCCVFYSNRCAITFNPNTGILKVCGPVQAAGSVCGNDFVASLCCVSFTPTSTDDVYFYLGKVRGGDSNGTRLTYNLLGNGIVDSGEITIINGTDEEPFVEWHQGRSFSETKGVQGLVITRTGSGWNNSSCYYLRVKPSAANESVSAKVRFLTDSMDKTDMGVKDLTGTTYHNVCGCSLVNWSSAPTCVSSSVNTTATSSNANYYLTFVDSNNATADSEDVYTNAGLYYNPNGGTLTANIFYSSCATGFTAKNSTTGGQLYLGSTSVAIGTNVFWQGENCCNIAIGYCPRACYKDTVAIGTCAKAYSSNSIAIGCDSMARGGSTIALGTNARALDAGSVSIGYNATACIGFLALGTCAKSDVATDATIAMNPKFPYSSIIEIDNIKYGRHGRIKFVIPSCSRNIDITSFFNYLFLTEINNGRCENTWSTSSWENIPTLVAHLSGFYWDDGGSSDSYQRWAPGINGRGNINELILLNTSAAASSNLSVYDLIVTCGKNICTTSWNWGTGTNVWTCGMVGTIEF